MSGTNDAKRLRAAAEARLRGRLSRPSSSSDSDWHRLQFELEVHQIELEMQNEELRRAQAETEALLANYTDLYDFAPVGYMTLRDDSTLLAVNLTGARVLGRDRVGLVGAPVAQLFAWADRAIWQAFLRAVLAEEPSEPVDLHLEGIAPGRVVRLTGAMTPGRRECRIAFTDVTRPHAAEVERERLFQELQASALEIKQLKGILPICAYCKKIRDDKGYWEKIEAYIEDHSEAVLSHGICPTCAKAHFPTVKIPGA
jgi:PAS domain-containing protein